MSRTRQRYEDPTHTQTLQRSYARKLRGRFADINTEIRAGVRDRDILGLREEQLADFEADDLRDFSFERSARKERRFRQWLDRQLQRGVLTTIDVDDNQYIQRAYDSGLRAANTDLRRNGVEVGTTDLSSIRNQPIHRDKLELLFTRNFEALEGITSEVSKEVSRVLTDSLTEGVNPRVASERLTDRVDSIGKTRATTLARTETLNAHNQSAIERYSQVLGEDAEVEIVAEVIVTQDRRTCEECEPRHGQTMTLSEARSNGPPWHPSCRCTLRMRARNQ